MSLQKKAISGLFWTFSQQFSVQAINILVGIILARILMPSAFGLIGMLSIFIAIGNNLLDSGMTSSLIRSKDPDQSDYSTVFLMNLIFSVLFYIIIFCFAPLIAKFYKQPILSPIIKVYTLCFIITALVGVQTTKLTKEMRFKEQMFMQIPSTIIGSCFGIFLAKKGYGVWALVWMNLIQTSLFTIQHWIFSGWRPELAINKAKLKVHFGFGYKLTIVGIINAIYTNVYAVLIGRFFAANQVGYYTQARNLEMLPINNISSALVKVTFPLFASFKEDNVKLKAAYRKLLHQVIFWVAPLMVFLIVIAKPFFLLLLTEKWLPAVPYFQILCVSGILYPFHVYNLNILTVKGRSDLFLKLEIIKKTFISVGVIIAIFYGIYGLLFFQIIESVFAFGVNTYYTGKFINYTGLQQLKEIGPTIILASLIGIILFIVIYYLNKCYTLNNIYIITGSFVTYSGLFYLFAWLLKFKALIDLHEIVSNKIKRK